ADEEIKVLRREAALAEVDTKTRRVRAIISDERLDRHGTVVLQSGLVRPPDGTLPMLVGHNAAELPIGRWTTFRDRVLKGGIAATEATGVVAADDAHPQAASVWRLLQAGILNSASIGFVARAVREPTVDDRRRYGDGIELVFTESELTEVSLVSVPSNVG